MAPDPLAAELAAIELRQEAALRLAMAFGEHAELRAFAQKDSPRLLLVAERALAAASDWEGAEGSGPAAEATRSQGRQLEDIIRRALLGGSGAD